MPQDATLHVKMDPETAERLKQLAHARGKSKGQMVREAISSCYQTSMSDLPIHQQQAVAAYQGGYISAGKLAKVMGLSILDLRHWLNDHDIPQSNAYGEDDAAHA